MKSNDKIFRLFYSIEILHMKPIYKSQSKEQIISSD